MSGSLTYKHTNANWRLYGVYASVAALLLDRNITSASLKEGDVYYDTTLNMLRTYDGSSWSPAGQSGTSIGSLDAAAQVGAKITNADQVEVERSYVGAITVLDQNSTNASARCLNLENASNDAASITLDFASTNGYDIDGTSSTWYVTYAGGALFNALSLLDDKVLHFGNAVGSGDVQIKWDQTNLLIEAAADDTGQIRIGATNSMDFKVYGSTSTKTALFDVSTAILDLNDWDIRVQDDDILKFGDGSDVTMTWDASNLLIEAATDNVGQIRIGSTNAMDLNIYDSSAAKNALFDVSEAILNLNGWDILLQNDDILAFGDSNDVTITWNNTDLLIEAATDDTGAIKIGASNSMDFIVYGSTATNIATFDVSAAKLLMNGWNVKLYDDNYLAFGSSADGAAADADIRWDQSNLVINAYGAGIKINDHVTIGTVTTDEESLTVNGNLTVTGTLTHTGSYTPGAMTFADDVALTFGTDADITLKWDQTKLAIDGVAADTSITIGKTNNQDLVIYGDTSTDAITFDTSAESMSMNGFDLSLLDDDKIKLGDSSDIVVQWDQTALAIDGAAGAEIIDIGKTTVVDVRLNGNTSGADCDWDCTNNTLALLDDAKLGFGNTTASPDVTLTWNQTNLLVEARADNTGQVRIGSTNALDLAIYGSTNTNIVLFDVNDATSSTVDINGWNVRLQDADTLKFGDSSDITIQWDATDNLLIDGAAANTAIKIGKANQQDLIVYGATTTKYIQIDSDDTANALILRNFRETHDDGTSTFTIGPVASNALPINAGVADETINIGDSTRTDVILHGGTATYDLHWDATVSTLGVLDNAKIGFGNTAAAPDVSLTWNTTNLLIEAATDNTGQIRIGNTNAMDVAIYGSTNTQIALFDVNDTTTSVFDLNGWNIRVQDADKIIFGDSNDVSLNWDQSNLLIEALTDNVGQIRVGSTNAMDVAIYGSTNTQICLFDVNDTTTSVLDLNGWNLRLQDLDYIKLGDSNDITITWDASRCQIDGAAADTAIWVGYANNQDVIVYGDTTTDAITIDTSAESIALDGFDMTVKDDDLINFGDSKDVAVTWVSASTALTIEALTDNVGAINVGSTNALDVAIYGSTNTNIALFDVNDTTASTFDLNGWDIRVQDADVIRFGDSDDITMQWDATTFLIDGAAADTVIAIGKTNNQDVVIYGDTTTDAVTFDTSAELVIANGFDLQMQDDDKIYFGDSTSDCAVQWDQTQLQVTPSSAVFVGDKTNYVSLGSTGNVTFGGTAIFVANSSAANMGGLRIPFHASSSPSGAGGAGAIWFEVDASKLWVNSSGTNWVGTVLS